MRRTAGGWKCAIAVGLCAALGIAGTAEAAEQTYPTKGPGGNKFYKPPKQLPKGHGALIWQRKATGITPVAGAKNRLVLYTSKTPQGKATAVSGIVSFPKGQPPQGGWPVVSFAHGTTGTADPCAPTRVARGQPAGALHRPTSTPSLRTGSAPATPSFAPTIRASAPLARTRIWSATAEGRGVVDIVSAARELYPLIARRYLISGHSQGGQSALFAAGLA